ncbi:complement C3-like [Styela clava]
MKLLQLCMQIFMAVLCTRTSFGQNHLLIAPQILREGVRETAVLNLYNINGRVDVVATVKLEGVTNFEIKNKDATKPIIMKIQYDKPPGVLPSNRRQYVELLVSAKQGNKKVYSGQLRMRLIESSGYIHLQTDRPIYRPEERVNVRVIALTQTQSPEEHREVEIVIRIPLDNVGVEKKLLRMPKAKFIDTSFELPEYPVYGIWSIQARYTDEKVVRWSTTTFDVRPYVLPTFNVRVLLDDPYVLVKTDMSNEYIRGTITADYSYGRKVSGPYFLAAKLNRPDIKSKFLFYQMPELRRTAKLRGGEQRFEIKATEVLAVIGDDTFDDLEKEGATIEIDVAVTGEAEGVVESDRSRPIMFVRSPYQLDISRMSKYYTPRTSFEIKVDVLDSVTNSPVKKVELVLTGPKICGTLDCGNDKCCSNGKCGECEPIVEESDENGQVNFKIDMDKDPVKRTYTIQTRKLGIPSENLAKLDFTLHPYISSSGSYLQLSAVEKIAEVGDKNFGIDVWYKSAPSKISYVIMARGAIISTGVHIPKKGSVNTNIKIEIKGEMVPSFRFFVYFFSGKELLSNSLWVDVKDACKQELQVKVPAQVLPSQVFNVEYIGSPNAILGMSAVDRAAYFLYDKGRLTRSSVFEALNLYDEGCVREGGKNAQHVFEEAGLQVVGGLYSAKDDFTNHCEAKALKRKKRSAPKNIVAKLEKEALERKCLMDGSWENLYGTSCVERAEAVRLKHSFECAEKFLKGCEDYRRTKRIAREGGRSIQANAAGFQAVANNVRSNFEENMLWATDVILGPDGKYTRGVVAKDSITTFEFDTVSMHEIDGFCVAPTQNVTIFKDVFVQLKLPYSLKRMEQAEIRATVFNYATTSKRLTVYVKMGEDICSHFRQGKFDEVITLEVDANEAETASFALLPLRVPDSEHVDIEVKITNEDNVDIDHVKRSILVQPEGEIKNDIKGTYAIDLKNKRPSYIDRFKIDLRFPKRYLAGSRQCWIYPFSNYMGPIIEFDPVTKQPKNDIKNLIRMPGGCGEQTMLSMGPNVMAHKYLKLVGRMKDGSAEETGSIDKMQKGFANQLKYRASTAPIVWSVFPRHAPSVWLNAYVNKIFAQAKQFYTAMDVGPICTSINWLVDHQNPDGSFKSGGRVIHQEMHGAVGSTLSLSAYVMMSLVESQSICPQHTKKVEISILKATDYLKNSENDRQMEQPYALSLVCFALSVSNPNDPFAKRMRKKLLTKINYSEDNRLAFWKGAPFKTIEGTGTHAYWYKRNAKAIDVEATGYALLSLLYAQSGEKVTQNILDVTRKIVLWIIQQRDEKGGFSTTQDTVVGLQALAEYMIWSSTVEPPTRDVKIDLTISSPNGSDWYDEPKRIHLDKSNENSTTPIPIPSNVISGGELNIQAQGEGEGTLSYRCVYRTLVDEDACHYDISVSTEEDRIPLGPVAQGDGAEILKLKLYISKPKGEPSGQSIVEINLISGYEVMEDTLVKLSETVDASIERYEIAKQKVFLYLSDITEVPKKLAFRISRSVYVGRPEPSTVTVYDYYEPSVRCSKFYNVPEQNLKLRTSSCTDKNGLGREDICKCAEGGCLTCRTRKQQLQHTGCLEGTDGECTICNDPDNCFDLADIACKSDYVYEVKVTSDGVEDPSGVFMDFAIQIAEVYKAGGDRDVDRNQNRNFSIRRDCFESCRDDEVLVDKDGKKEPFLKKDRTLLLIGNSVEMNYEDDDNILKGGELPSPHYRLGAGMFVERIYPTTKCKKSKKKAEEKKCRKLKKKTPKSTREECLKHIAIHQSCTNLRLLRKLLTLGCDSERK